ncbi:MAG: hypothetical protein IPP71_17535 [Bacteroidetes bacterium]|nr:hypothetical protein [Bacteroidota bacterium]
MKLVRYFTVFIFFYFFSIPVFSQYWMQSGGSVTIDEGLAICSDSNNNIYTTGYFTSSFEMNGYQLNAQGLEDIFISKMNSAGNISWLIRAGAADQERALSIDADQAGNIVITGYFYGTTIFGTTTLLSQGQQDIFIAKYDSFGNLLWARQAGSSTSDIGNSVKFDHAGNIIVTGEFSGTCNFSTSSLTSQAGTVDAFIAKYDGNGNVVWVKKGSGNFIDRGTGVAIDLQNNIYVSGTFSDSISFDVLHPNVMMNSVFVIKLSATGVEQWFRWLGSGISVNGGGINFSSNGINLTGDFSGTLVFFGLPGSPTINPTLPFNSYIGRLNSSGNLAFFTSKVSDNEINSTCISSKANGDIIIGGNFKCRFKDFSSQYGAGVFCSMGFWDNYLTSYSISGTWLWARHFAGKQNDVIKSLSVYNDSLPVFTGSYQSDYCIPVRINQITAHGTLAVDYNFVDNLATFCNDNYYGQHLIYESKGNSDVFINAAVNLLREPLDYFKRTTGTCNRTYNNMCITGPLGICGDTIFTCTTGTLSMHPGLGQGEIYFYALAPLFNFAWSNGATTGTFTTAAPGAYAATATSIDGCFTHNASSYLLASYQPKPELADNKGFNSGTTSPQAIELCFPDSVELSCTNPANSTVTWVGFAPGLNPVSVDSSGTYNCLLTNQYGCINSTEIEVTITNPLAGAILPKLKWINDIDGNDSITICANQVFEILFMMKTLTLAASPCNAFRK